MRRGLRRRYGHVYDRDKVVTRAAVKLTPAEATLLRAMRARAEDEDVEAVHALGQKIAMEAMASLHRKKLVGRPDGGYLTNIGIDVADRVAVARVGGR